MNDETHDPMVDGTENARRRSAAAGLFDIRRVIDGLFAVYGVIITIVGILDGRSAIDKAGEYASTSGQGAACSPSACSLLWQRLRPVHATPTGHPEDPLRTDRAARPATRCRGGMRVPIGGRSPERNSGVPDRRQQP